MVEHLFCNQGMAVRFCHGAPSFRIVTANSKLTIWLSSDKSYPVKLCLRTLIGSAACLRSRWLGVRIRPKVPSYGGRTREVNGSMGPEVHHQIQCPCTLIGSAGRLKICWMAVRICPGVPKQLLNN